MFFIGVDALVTHATWFKEGKFDWITNIFSTLEKSMEIRIYFNFIYLTTAYLKK